MAENLPPSSADVTESGNLNLPRILWAHRPVMGLFYFYLLLISIFLLHSATAAETASFKTNQSVNMKY
jgi:hypothetical protein